MEIREDIQQFKYKYLSKRCQFVLFGRGGKIIESCNTLINFNEALTIYQRIPFLDGIQEVLDGMESGSPAIIFPRIEIGQDDSTIKAFDFFVEKIESSQHETWLMIMEDNTEEHLYISQLQQEGKESMIEREFLELQKLNKQRELDFKNRELASNILHIVHKNELLEDIYAELKKISEGVQPETQRDLKKVIRSIENNLKQNNDWDNFKLHFEQVHPSFFETLLSRFPSLTQTDLKVCAYIQLNFSTKEIAKLLNISFRSVQIYKYRLKKKMNLNEDTDLKLYLQSILYKSH